MPKYTDTEIVAAIKAGGRKLDEVMRFIYNNDGYRSKIFRYIRSKGGQIHDAEDVFQDGIRNFIISIRKGQYREESSVEGYLFGVCRNLWFKQFNKSTRVDYKEDVAEEEVDFQNPEIVLVTEERKAILKKLLANLGEKCQQVLELWRLNYSMKEIAESTGYASDGMARKKKHQCMQELLKRVKSTPNLVNILKE